MEGRSGTAKSVAYAPATGMLYVLHSFGPDHVRLISVDDEDKLTLRPERYTVNTHDKPNRVRGCHHAHAGTTDTDNPTSCPALRRGAEQS